VPAIAAPFCVVSEAVPAQCIYYDADLCQQRADQMGAGAHGNTNEVKPTPSVGHYCLVTSGRKEATHQQAACIIAPTRPGRPTPDPFMLIRPGNAGLF